MKIALKQLINSQEAFGKLLQEKLPVKTAYRLQKNFRVIEPEIKDYENLRSKMIIEKYGEEEEAGNGQWKVSPRHMDAFVVELTELMNVEVDIDISKVTLPDDCKITPSDIYSLDWLLIVEDDEVTKEDVK